MEIEMMPDKEIKHRHDRNNKPNDAPHAEKASAGQEHPKPQAGPHKGEPERPKGKPKIDLPGG
jgi:hypothetical protein